MMDVRAPIAAAAPTLHPRRADPCAFVIFGAGGDLTKRLLVPALYNLMAAQLLPDDFAVIYNIKPLYIQASTDPGRGSPWSDRRALLPRLSTSSIAFSRII